MVYLHEKPFSKPPDIHTPPGETDLKTMLSAFYKPQIINNLCVVGDKSFHFGNLRYTSGDKALTELQHVSPDQAAEFYWGLHTQDYLNRLDNLLSRAKHADNEKTAKYVLVIASMNETATDQAIAAFSESFGKNFDNHVVILLYHNYKTTPLPEVTRDIAKCVNRPNVTLIEEQVKPDNTVVLAKKVASDLALRSMVHNQHLPMTFTDADVKWISPGAIQTSARALSHTGIIASTMTTSCETDETREKYPVFAFIEKLSTLIRIHDYQNKLLTPCLLGMFYTMDATTFMAVGGLKPANHFQNNLLKTTFEDMKLTGELYKLFASEKPKIFANLTETHSMRVITDSSREIFDLISSFRQDERWHNVYRYSEVSGSTRFDFSQLPHYPDIPKLADLTPTNITTALANYWEEIVLGNYSLDILEHLSNLLLQTLFEMGVTEINYTYTHTRKRSEIVDVTINHKSCPIIPKNCCIINFTGLKF
jgi:hypothetical protein